MKIAKLLQKTVGILFLFTAFFISPHLLFVELIATQFPL